MALREVGVPQHITILYVQQEVIGDDTPALESVLQADVHRTRLMAEERELNKLLQTMEDRDASGADGPDGAAARTRQTDDATARLGEVQKMLLEIDADSGPARAGELLAGLGFDVQDQVGLEIFLVSSDLFDHTIFLSMATRRDPRNRFQEDGGCVCHWLVLCSANPIYYYSMRLALQFLKSDSELKSHYLSSAF